MAGQTPTGPDRPGKTRRARKATSRTTIPTTDAASSGDASDGSPLAALSVAAWPVRRKIVLAIAVPVVLAGVLGGLRVQGDLAVSANSSSSARQVTILLPTVHYLTNAENAMVTAQDPSSTKADIATAENRVVSSAAALVKARRSADLNPEQDAQVENILDLSQALRDSDTEALSQGTYEAQLRQLDSGVTQLITTIVNAQRNPDPQLELLSQTLSGRFSLALEQTLVDTTRTGATGSLELFAELGAESSAIDRLAASLGESEPAVTALRTANADRIRTVRTGGTDLGGTAAYTAYDDLSNKLLTSIGTDLSASAHSARTKAWVGAAITILALLAALLLALLITRLLLNPIRKVREGALTVAHDVLPLEVARIRAGLEPGELVPIDVTTREEMGQLARAVDDLHRQAVHLASGEAQLRAQVGEMFVTLSRRSTSLVNQQLGLIEELERDEENPRRLDSLFRLDHLAARMRRTADSLLILADAPVRPGAGEEHLTVADSLQAATSGVQDYQRVRVASSSTLRISPAAGGDVVHLLTELVDNALAFSPPESTVAVTSSTGPDGVRIEIADAGLGMPEEAIGDLNDLLRTGGSATAETARRMGLFVVSRLAQRHGVTVSLRRNLQQGVTATVLLPPLLLPDLDHTARPAAPRIEDPVALESVSEVVVEEPTALSVVALVPDPVPVTEPEPLAVDVVSTPEPTAEPTVAVAEPVPAVAPPLSPYADVTSPRVEREVLGAAPAVPEPALTAFATPTPNLANLAKLGKFARNRAAAKARSQPVETAPTPVAAPAPVPQLDVEDVHARINAALGLPPPVTAAPTSLPRRQPAAAVPVETGPLAPITPVRPAAPAAPVELDLRPTPEGMPLGAPVFATPAPPPPVSTPPTAVLGDPEDRSASPEAVLEAHLAFERDEAEPVLPVSSPAGPAPAAAATEPVAVEESVFPEPDAVPVPDPTPTVSSEPEPEYVEETHARVIQLPVGPVADRPTAVVPEPQPVAVPEAEPETAAVVEPEPALVAEPEPAAWWNAPAAAASVLEGPIAPDVEVDDGGIFATLRSAWMSAGGGDEPWTSTELEAGWQQAAQVAEPVAETPVTKVGLPARQPGSRLVPGGVTRLSGGPATRDPEAVRQRLSAHAAGVQRGRNAAAATHATNSALNEHDPKAGPA